MRRRGLFGVLAVAVCAVALPVGASAGSFPITVDTLSDTVAADGHCSLREAIQNHNLKNNANADCRKGNSTDQIRFSVSGQITLAGSELPAVQGKLTIDGGGVITIDGNTLSRIIETTDGSTLTLQGLTLAHGSASGDGGAVLNADAKLTLDDVTISHNAATGSGGGVYAPDGGLKIDGSTFDHNTAANAAGLGGLNVVVTWSTFDANHASVYGGGLYTFGLTMAHSTVSNNIADAGFGGLAVGGGQGTIQRSTFESNSAPTGGGVVVQAGGGSKLILDGDSIVNNTASCNAAGFGTQTFAGDATVQILNSTISGNSITTGACTSGGGGVLNLGPGTLTIANSTISGNTSANAYGGAVFNAGTLVFLNATVAENDPSGSGVGIYGDDSGLWGGTGATSFANTIVSNNANGLNCGGTGTFTSQGHNLESDDACYFGQPSDQVEIDPLLQPLGNYGGPTQTMLPQLGSPAVDHGDDAVCKAKPIGGKDQRGFKRPKKHCDIGSVELIH